jgi:putative transposase
MKKDPQLAFLTEVSSVPLQQALRHQHQAFAAFYAGRARYPRFKSRRSRQCAHYTRSAFSLRGGVLRLAKTAAPLRFTWSWPEVDVAGLDPAMVIVAREPDGRWYVTFTIDVAAPEPLPPAGRAVGVDLGVQDFAVTSDGEKIANPWHLARRACNLARYQRRLARCRKGSANRARAAAKAARAHRKVRHARGLPAPGQHPAGPPERPDRDRRPRGREHDPQPPPRPRHLRLRLGRVPPPA